MPRYFFDVHDGDKMVVDESGLNLDGIESARDEAVKALPDIARDTSLQEDQRTVVVGVRDENGQRVLMAALSLSVQRLV